MSEVCHLPVNVEGHCDVLETTAASAVVPTTAIGVGLSGFFYCSHFFLFLLHNSKNKCLTECVYFN